MLSLLFGFLDKKVSVRNIAAAAAEETTCPFLQSKRGNKKT